MTRSPQVKALEYLISVQQSDGGFLSFSSPQVHPFKPTYAYHTIFAPALILSSICRSDLPEARTLRQKTAAFLLSKRSKHWSFNYWSDGPELTTRPFPDDLDDTFCALSSLWLHDQSLIDETALAHIVKILLAAETEVGGPYRTWLVPQDSPSAWLDVDIAVNANIAHFLSLAINPLPNVTKLLEEAITQQNLVSPYYQSEYPIIYFIARAYNDRSQEDLAAMLMAKHRPDTAWGTSLHTALAISSLYYLGQPIPQSAVQFLLGQQQADGSWAPEAFCIDPKRDGTTFYNGAASLTTAFAIEALSLYDKQRQTEVQTIHEASSALLSEAPKTALGMLHSLEPSIRATLTPVMLHTLEGKNAEEVLLLPELFYHSLAAKPALPKHTITNLSLANLFGWVAYTIYDDILDGDTNSHMIPAANVAMRRSLQLFEQAVPRAERFYQHVHHVFDVMDNANAWEATSSRFTLREETIHIDHLPDYLELDRLAERSLGHTLSPIGVLAAAGIDVDALSSQNIQKALHHYLIARQLNDDAHDWEEDLLHGRATYVVTRILRQLGAKPGDYRLTDLASQAGRQFWHYTLRDICYKISRHTRTSRRELDTSALLVTGNILERLLNDTDATVAKTLATVDQANRFLEAYKNPA